MRKKIILLITILFAIIAISIILKNNTETLKNILGIKKPEENQLFSYLVYDNQNEEEIKVLLKINSETGIEYIEKTDGSQVQVSGK